MGMGYGWDLGFSSQVENSQKLHVLMINSIMLMPTCKNFGNILIPTYIPGIMIGQWSYNSGDLALSTLFLFSYHQVNCFRIYLTWITSDVI